jgi:CheY-like chemotaxis protein
MSLRAKILLIEDEEHVAKLVVFKLTREGYETTWAKNGEEGLEHAVSGRWDLILLDVMMPLLDGWQVLASLRKQRVPTPVLMLTAQGSDRDNSKSIELGADRLLKKPFDLDELVVTIGSMIPGERRRGKEDAEFKVLRDEFIASFMERRLALSPVLVSLSAVREGASVPNQIAYDLRVIAHNLAGVAKSYGFPVLGELAGRIDDSLCEGQEMAAAKPLLACAELLDRALKTAYETGADLSESAVTSFSGFPAFAARP